MKPYIYIFVTLALGFAAAGALAQLGGGGYGGRGISGPSSVTDNAIVRYDGTTGKRVQGSGVTIDDSNAMTNTSQPCFLAHNSVTDVNVTGSSAITIDFDTEIFDQGADFATDTFTAPVTGRYHFAAGVDLNEITTAADTVTIELTTTNRTYTGTRFNLVNGLPTVFGLTISAIADMDATDTATIVVQVTGETGDPVDVLGSATALNTFFSGCLVS